MNRELKKWVYDKSLEEIQEAGPPVGLWEGLIAPALTGKTMASLEDTAYQWFFRELSEEEQDQAVSDALDKLKADRRIAFKQWPKSTDYQLFKTGRTHQRYLVALGVLDSIVEATTPPKLLTLKLPDAEN